MAILKTWWLNWRCGGYSEDVVAISKMWRLFWTSGGHFEDVVAPFGDVLINYLEDSESILNMLLTDVVGHLKMW